MQAQEEKTIFDKKDLDSRRWRSLAQELEAYLGRPVEDIAKEYFAKIGSHKDFSNVYKDEKGVQGFYQDTDHYLYELLYWEGCASKYAEFRKLLLFIKKFKLKKILDYGGGVGGFCIYLSGFKVNCDYLDLPGRTSEFALWRFQNRRMPNRKFLLETDLPFQEYELVVSYDVLEHVFDVEQSVKAISNLTALNGYFVCKCSFSGDGLHLTKNEQYQDLKLFNKMLEEHGLKFFGRIKSALFFGIRIDKKVKYGGNFLIFKKFKGNFL
jgi:cyclopropane fatty-acyl-phospholipid synthase-like methyltransferase